MVELAGILLDIREIASNMEEALSSQFSDQIDEDDLSLSKIKQFRGELHRLRELKVPLTASID